jgi:para-aminobenzoate synthetase/4-amino-4-deoxychorismate lyase
VARHLEGEARAVAFIGAWAGGGALLADRPVEVAGPDDDPFVLLDQTGDGTWAGWLGYRLGRRLERLPPDGVRPVARPAAVLARFDHVCRCDPEGRWWVESTGPVDPSVVERWQDRLGAPPPSLAWSAGAVSAQPDRGRHIGSVEEAVLRIGAGELYQANVCLRLETAFSGSPLGLWCDAGAQLQPARAGFVADEAGAVASLSPEVFLLRHGRRARTEPVKGTRPLTAAGRADLLAAEKDAAEHVMIVDLVRNDLGRVCRPGSVRVARLLEAEPLAGVWHLVSAVEGVLAEGQGDADLVRACFPPGSVTGAPKVAAQALCSRLEPSAREAYCGAMGFASPDHGLELNVAIRTFEVSGGRLWLGVGGGIVAGSDGAAEWDECRAKAAPLLAAAGIPAWDEPAGVAPRPGACFDTMLLVEGRVVERDGHLARFREATGLDAAVAVDGAAAAHPRGAWRVRVEQGDGEGVTTSVVATARPPVLDGRWAVADIALVALPGGQGDRKRAERRDLEELEARLSPAVPVLCDADGSVLEATWANVVAVVGGVVCTPALDGRILPGVTRRALLDEAVDLGLPLRIGRLGASDLVAADAILLTSAVRGLTWVRRVDDRRCFDLPHPLVATLAAALGRRWCRPGGGGPRQSSPAATARS